MFDALKNLFADVSGSGAPARNRGEEDRRLAAVALLVNVPISMAKSASPSGAG